MDESCLVPVRVLVKKQDRKLNEKEQRVVDVLRASGEPMRIRQVAADAFPEVSAIAQADWWVRNSVRKLIRIGAVRYVERGTYQAMPK